MGWGLEMGFGDKVLEPLDDEISVLKRLVRRLRLPKRDPKHGVMLSATHMSLV